MNFKRTAAAVCAASMLACGAVYAEYDPNKVVLENEVSTKMIDRIAIAIDGNYIETPEVLTVDGNVIIPLRAVAESLGYNVIWHEDKSIELMRGAHYITLSIDNDAYTFARMAPMSLGVAPKLINSLTYVPVNFVSDVMQLNAEITDNVVEIKTVSEETQPTEEIKGNAVIIEITEEEILIADDEIGEVRLVLGEDCVVENENGEKIEKDAFAVGQRLAVEYSEVMTNSLPPLNNPTKIVAYAVEEATEELVVGKAEITEITEEGIMINDETLGEVMLVISDETVITNAEGEAVNAEEFAAGQKLTVTYSPAMTLSLPPINNPVSIVVE